MSSAVKQERNITRGELFNKLDSQVYSKMLDRNIEKLGASQGLSLVVAIIFVIIGLIAFGTVSGSSHAFIHLVTGTTALTISGVAIIVAGWFSYKERKYLNENLNPQQVAELLETLERATTEALTSAPTVSKISAAEKYKQGLTSLLNNIEQQQKTQKNMVSIQ